MYEDHGFSGLCIDTGSELELDIHNLISQDHGKGDAFGTGNMDFKKGENIATEQYWVPYLKELDRLRVKKNMMIMVNCHAKTGKFHDPQHGAYDEWGIAMDKSTSELLGRWGRYCLVW